MKVILKEEFYEFSIGGGSKKKVKMKNIPEEKWLGYYNSGYDYMFDVVKPVKKRIIEDDINRESGDKEGLFDA